MIEQGGQRQTDQLVPKTACPLSLPMQQAAGGASIKIQRPAASIYTQISRDQQPALGLRTWHRMCCHYQAAASCHSHWPPAMRQIGSRCRWDGNAQRWDGSAQQQQQR